MGGSGGSAGVLTSVADSHLEGVLTHCDTVNGHWEHTSGALNTNEDIHARCTMIDPGAEGAGH